MKNIFIYQSTDYNDKYIVISEIESFKPFIITLEQRSVPISDNKLVKCLFVKSIDRDLKQSYKFQTVRSQLEPTDIRISLRLKQIDEESYYFTPEFGGIYGIIRKNGRVNRIVYAWEFENAGIEIYEGQISLQTFLSIESLRSYLKKLKLPGMRYSSTVTIKELIGL